LTKKFSLKRVQRSAARFDEAKLVWLNGQWIRKIYDDNPGELYRRVDNCWGEQANGASKELKNTILGIIYDRLKSLTDLENMTKYFFTDPEVDLQMLLQNKFLNKLSEEELQNLLQATVKKLKKVEDWTTQPIQNALNELLVETKSKPAALFSAIRIALTFAPFSPALPETMQVLSKETVLARLNATATALSNER
jgi:glutamyl-tRNA synthetase